MGGSYNGAACVNDSGQITGYRGVAGNASRHAFVYNNGAMSDLNNLIDANSEWTLMTAQGINDAGQIIGYYEDSNGMHGFLYNTVRGNIVNPIDDGGGSVKVDFSLIILLSV